MSMSKKDFIALADVIRAEKPGPTCPYPVLIEQWEWLRDRLANFCAAQNPRFNRARWLAYIAGECGPNGGRKAPIPACAASMGCLCVGHARNPKRRECDTRE